MKKNNTAELLTAVGTGVVTLWKSYKQTARRRNETEFESFLNDLFGREMSDVEAAKCLAEDVADIRNTIRRKKTDKKFDQIINNSF